MFASIQQMRWIQQFYLHVWCSTALKTIFAEYGERSFMELAQHTDCPIIQFIISEGANNQMFHWHALLGTLCSYFGNKDLCFLAVLFALCGCTHREFIWFCFKKQIVAFCGKAFQKKNIDLLRALTTPQWLVLENNCWVWHLPSPLPH